MAFPLVKEPELAVRKDTDELKLRFTTGMVILSADLEVGISFRSSW